MSGSEPITALTAAAPSGPRAPVRVRVTDIMLWVLVASIAAAACRRLRPVARIDLTRLFGMGTAVLAVFVGIGLLRQAVAYDRRRHTEGGAPHWAAVAWRLVVVALLAALLIVEARELENWPRALWEDTFEPVVWLRLLLVSMTFVLAGVLAGLAPLRDTLPERPGAWTGISVSLGLAACVMIALNQAIIPYLALTGIEGFRNATRGPVALRPMQTDFHGRLIRAGVDSGIVLACCLLLVIQIARELRRPTQDSVAPGTSWRGPLALLAATSATGVGAVWLFLVTLPRLNEWLAEGFRLSPQNAALLLLGFAGLALGLAARAADRSPRPVPKRPSTHLRALFLQTVRILAIALITLVLMARVDWYLLASQTVLRRGSIPVLWVNWVNWINGAFGRLYSVLPLRELDPEVFQTAPEVQVLALAQAWVFWRAGALLLMPAGARATPIDLSLGDTRRLARFLICWLALTVLMIAALPAWFLVGLALLTAFLRALG